MVTRNPYFLTTPIDTDADFVGREPDLRRIFEVVSGPQPQSLCLYGERRIGKSRLLRAFERRAAATLTPAARYLVLKSTCPGSNAGRARAATDRAGQPGAAEDPALTTSTTALTDLIDRVAAAGQR